MRLSLLILSKYVNIYNHPNTQQTFQEEQSDGGFKLLHCQ